MVHAIDKGACEDKLVFPIDGILSCNHSIALEFSLLIDLTFIDKVISQLDSIAGLVGREVPSVSVILRVSVGLPILGFIFLSYFF